MSSKIKYCIFIVKRLKIGCNHILIKLYLINISMPSRLQSEVIFRLFGVFLFVQAIRVEISADSFEFHENIHLTRYYFFSNAYLHRERTYEIE